MPVVSRLRGSARSLTGLALAAVLASCGPGDPEPRPVPSSDPVPSSEATAEVSDQSEDDLAPFESRADGHTGLYTLQIPRVEISAPIVAIESDEQVLVPPRDPGLVGWWDQGVAPGSASGATIMVGHTVRSGPGVFDDIGRLQVGDQIEVEGAGGSSVTYRVDSVDVLSVEEVAARAEHLFDQTGPARLVLVTCEDWDGGAWRSNAIAIALPV